MTPAEVAEKLKSIIQSTYNTELNDADLIAETLGLDSLEALELVMTLEDEWPKLDGVFDDPDVDLGTVEQLSKRISDVLSFGGF